MAADSTSVRVRVFEDVEELSRAAASAFAEAAEIAVRERGRFSAALAGGRTPRTLYRVLATRLVDSIPWSRVHLFWSDERFVPPEDPESNYRMARETLLERVPVPEKNVRRPDTGLGDPDEAARRYEAAVRAFFAPARPRFDCMILGLGEDGHVASLFPGSSALEERERLVVAVGDSPKPPPLRLTMTLPLINASRDVHVLVAGREKKRALGEVLKASTDLPAGRVRPVEGALHFWVDRQAAA